MTRQELEGLIKAIANKMRADDNTKLVTKYIEHLSWLLFLKVHEAMEEQAVLVEPRYTPIIDEPHRWSTWVAKATKKAADAWSAEELIQFINTDLFPYLRGLEGSRQAMLMADLFRSVTTVMKSGFGLKDVMVLVDKIDFHAPEDVHTFSVVYESLLARLGRDASWSGEHYTPRPIVKFMVQIVDPKLGDRVYDPACGSAGFLAESYEHMRPGERTLEDHERLTSKTFFGQESGELPVLLGTMNLILHGVTAPSLVRRNTLEENVRAIAPTRQYEVILTNPPFGGKENAQVQQNFPSKAAATEVLFLQHIIAFLKVGGRAGVVVPDGVLFRDDAAFLYVRKRLVDDFNLTGVVRMPLGTFPYAQDTRTNLLFFSKSGATSSVRYYQVRPPAGKKAFTKTRSVTAEVLAPALAWIRDGVADANSWEVPISDIRVSPNYDLDLLPPDVFRELDPKVVAANLGSFAQRAEKLTRLAERLARAPAEHEAYRLGDVVPLGRWIVERGPRSGEDRPVRFLGVSNTGGLVPFKGSTGRDARRYRHVRVNDFVYNPMRINVGSIALCRTIQEEGHASPDYVVFTLKLGAPFGPEYLLRYLQSSIGLRQIERNAQGTIRSRLYFENLCSVQVPVPTHPDAWDGVLAAFKELDELLLQIPADAAGSLAHLIDSLYLVRVDGAAAKAEIAPEPATA